VPGAFLARTGRVILVKKYKAVKVGGLFFRIPFSQQMRYNGKKVIMINRRRRPK